MNDPDDATTGVPFYLEGSRGKLFALYFPPRVAAGDARAVLFVPPFAEEMNRSRRMAALQARALAEGRVGALVIDLFGTGDSAGEFAEARWEVWLDDVRSAADWLRAQGVVRLSLCGLRMGALLAAAAARTGLSGLERVILWQPVASGEVMLNQFLRVAVAAAMTSQDRGVTTKTLRAQLAAGSPVEVAGYEINPELATAIDATRLERMPPPPDVALAWFELATEPGRDLAPASQRIIEAWRQDGCDVTARCVIGEPFWSLQWPRMAPELMAATAALFDGAVE